MLITFIQTGGTIDKDYPKKTKGWAFEMGEPAINRILEKLKPSFEFEVKTIFRKDSLEIKDEDRQTLVDFIKKLETENIIITHGTDTMIETALYLNSMIDDKTIVMTGALLPERFSNSDAPINLGAAIGALNILQPGTYVAMNGIVKKADLISRDLNTGKFF